MIEYSMEELMPILEKKICRYTSNDSTSVTYAIARQLMGSILFSIQGLDEVCERSSTIETQITAQEAYELGFQKRKEKIGLAKELFAHIKNNFFQTKNKCYRDTILAGMPAFFQSYQLEFDGQNAILTLDYPLHVSAHNQVMELDGIDRIYEYLNVFCQEQEYLNQYDPAVVDEVLLESHGSISNLITNLFETAFEQKERCSQLQENLLLISQEAEKRRRNKKRKKFYDGVPMPDEKLRNVMEEMSSCRLCSDKIEMMKAHIHSLADFKEVIRFCFWNDEYEDALRLLSEDEKTVLSAEVKQKMDMDEELEEWEQRLWNARDYRLK